MSPPSVSHSPGPPATKAMGKLLLFLMISDWNGTTSDEGPCNSLALRNFERMTPDEIAEVMKDVEHKTPGPYKSNPYKITSLYA